MSKKLLKPKIANKISDFNTITGKNIKSNSSYERKDLIINVTNLTGEQKEKLRGALKFFTGDRNNTAVKIVNNGETLPA